MIKQGNKNDRRNILAPEEQPICLPRYASFFLCVSGSKYEFFCVFFLSHTQRKSKFPAIRSDLLPPWNRQRQMLNKTKRGQNETNLLHGIEWSASKIKHTHTQRNRQDEPRCIFISNLLLPHLTVSFELGSLLEAKAGARAHINKDGRKKITNPEE